MNILTLNAGSATLKYKLFSMPDEKALFEGSVDNPGGSSIAKAASSAIEQCRAIGIDAIGHRVVQGNEQLCDPVVVTPAVFESLKSLRELDPLHNPIETELIDAAIKALPTIPNIANFDTAFHKTLPEIAWRYALPEAASERWGLRRYGFHGLSYQYVSSKLLECMRRDPVGSRLIVCHLGSGASVCAIKDGKSIDTSMGMTPLAGLIMGTRCGDVDPGLLLYFQRVSGCGVAEVEQMMNQKSGLLGVSGISADVRELEKAASSGDQKAELALDMFAYQVSKYVGAYAAVLGGLNALAFTGGIGENSSDMRHRICQRLVWMGISLMDETNQDISKELPTRLNADNRSVQVWVIPTNEELQIARNVYRMQNN